MKKLMIAAALTAMIGSAQAVTCVKTTVKDPCTGEKIVLEGAGTAHKVAISLKTTAIKNKNKRDKALCVDDCIYWRQQATKKINGLIWEQLPSCYECVPFGANSIFWTADKLLDVEFAIGAGLIGNAAKSKKIEAYGSLAGADFGALSWAGFGTIVSSVQGKDKSTCYDGDCVGYVKSITGGIAGCLVPEDWDGGVCGDTCDEITYEGCCVDEFKPLESTAAYGTIKITYDTATAKKVAVADEADDPGSFYKFPAAALIDQETGERLDPKDFVEEVAIEE